MTKRNLFTRFDHKNFLIFFFALPILVSLLVLLGPRFSLGADPDGFCQAIKKIIESGKTKFKSVRGELDLVSEEYFGTLTPPDLQDCFGWLDGRAYHCASKAGMTETEVGKAYDTFNEMIRSCLPDEWQTKERDMKRANARRFITYTSPSHPIKLKIGERSKRHGWFVDIYFNR